MKNALITLASRACLALGLLLTVPAMAADPAPAAAASAAVEAAPALAPVPAVPAPAADAHGGDNPYGIKALWAQSDVVAKTTLLILALMSIGSWYVIVTKLVEQGRVGGHARKVQEGFWNSASIREGTEKLSAASPFRFIAEKGLEGASKHEGLLGAVDFNTWVTMSIQRAIGHVQSRLQDGLAVLATVGSTAPFVGLFGTVWGIYNALVKIGLSGQASIDKVAGPVGESLIMTAIGLAVAVPAVLGYNWLVRRNKSAMEEVNAFGSDLHSVLLASAKK
ncbi:MotA/TolQ/ExbB proton channel family protein [Aquariibacter albus]|uniref:Biopolymer transport protein ExbB n=1 Tax=Aquariibacter albus TaxID=2759899 RepID=A0A839HRI9_9BURK|nr:MotA/TolQ/ExbB proton channel family protein [Aquariibacter albus]MBB1162218.1 MotA/TolQ/ExbB proton channel family protein [Aquariibacter albus]